MRFATRSILRLYIFVDSSIIKPKGSDDFKYSIKKMAKKFSGR